MKLFRMTVAAGLLVASGCDDSASDPPMDGPPQAGDSGGETTQTRFYEDVAPVLAQNCIGCHREGGVAPFSLETYDEARPWAAAIVSSTEARTMPPWNANNDGSCGTYQDARWLGDADIETLAKWADEGTPEGDPSLGVPRPPDPAQLVAQQIVTVETASDYYPLAQGIPEAMFDDYQCFLLDPGFDVDTFLVGFDIEPGNPRTVHHVLAFDVDPTRVTGGRTNEEIMAELDSLSPNQPGWDCFGAAGEGVWVEGVPVTWAPGTGATHFPGGSGIRIGAGHQLVVQMHYSLIDDDGLPDQTALRLALADEVEREAHQALADGFLATLLGGGEQLPAGTADATFSWEMALGVIPGLPPELGDVELLGVLPHMHQRGATMKVEIERDGETTCAMDVDRWDFNWQQTYFYDDAIPMTGADRFKVTCQWDTRGDDVPIGPGFGTDSEMCLIGVLVAER